MTSRLSGVKISATRLLVGRMRRASGLMLTTLWWNIGRGSQINFDVKFRAKSGRFSTVLFRIVVYYQVGVLSESEFQFAFIVTWSFLKLTPKLSLLGFLTSRDKLIDLDDNRMLTRNIDYFVPDFTLRFSIVVASQASIYKGNRSTSSYFRD